MYKNVYWSLMGLALLLSGCMPASDSAPSSSASVPKASASASASYSAIASASSAFSSLPSGALELGGGFAPLPKPTDSGGSSSGPAINIQAGTLTAGDYDDHLNPAMYQKYASDYFQGTPKPVANKSSAPVAIIISSSSSRSVVSSVSAGNDEMPYVDLTEKVRVVVLDENGDAFAGAQVDVIVDGLPLLHGMTSVKGELFIYPSYDGLPNAFDLQVSVSGSDTVIDQSVNLQQLADDRNVQVTLPLQKNAVTNVDIALVIDATGSMGDEMRYLQAELDSVFGELKNQYPSMDVRVGLIAYRDNGDAYVVRSFDFTAKIDEFSASLNAQSAGGGGDTPEAMDQALSAANALAWRENSVKVVLLAADAPPHSNRIQATWKEVEALRSRQAHIVPIAASGVARDAEYLMRTMALITQSRYLFLTDDSGVGNGHAEPTIDCYLVTRLDNVIHRVIEELIVGERIEPNESDIIRKVGIYNKGVCEAPPEASEDPVDAVAEK